MPVSLLKDYVEAPYTPGCFGAVVREADAVTNIPAKDKVEYRFDLGFGEMMDLSVAIAVQVERLDAERSAIWEQVLVLEPGSGEDYRRWDDLRVQHEDLTRRIAYLRAMDWAFFQHADAVSITTRREA